MINPELHNAWMVFISKLKVQMKCFFLFPNLKEQLKSGRSPFTVS